MTGRPLTVAAIAIVLCALAFNTVSAIPFTEAPDFRQMLGLSTSYYPQQDATTYTNPPETCTPVQIQRLARHGTRYPTIGTMRKLIKLESFIAAHICNATYPQSPPGQYRWLCSWKMPYPLSRAGELTTEGVFELYQQGKRFAQAFPQLFDGQPDVTGINVQASSVARTAISATSFSYGLLEGKGILGHDRFQPVFVDQDDVNLRFFAGCPTYSNHVKTPLEELVSKQKLKVLPPVVDRLAVTLHLNAVQKKELSAGKTHNFWQACVYELSILNITDRFCSLFSLEDALLLNTIDDFEIYHKSGYGSSLAWEIASPLVAQMLYGLRKATDEVERTGHVTSTFAALKFAHAETLVPAMCVLDLFHDPSVPDFADPLTPRLWRARQVTPYGSNIAIVLYHCQNDSSSTAFSAYPPSYSPPSDSSSNDDEDTASPPSSSSSSSTTSSKNKQANYFLVKMFHNEREVPIPHCNNTHPDIPSVYCDLAQFLSVYSKLPEYNYNSSCGIDTSVLSQGYSISPSALMIAIGSGVIGLILAAWFGAIMIGRFSSSSPIGHCHKFSSSFPVSSSSSSPSSSPSLPKCTICASSASSTPTANGASTIMKDGHKYESLSHE